VSFKKDKTRETSQQTQNQNFTQTTTPNAPQYLQDAIRGVATGAMNWLDNGQPLVTGPSALQQQAFDRASAYTPGYTAATYNAQKAKSQNLTDINLDKYFNPYQDDVIGAYTNDFNAASDRARALEAAEQSQSGGAYNSNNVIMSALSGDLRNRAYSTGVADLRNTGYNNAQNYATQDLNRAAQTSQFNAAQANAAAAANAAAQNAAMSQGSTQGLQQIGMLAELGEVQRGIANAQSGEELARLVALQQILAGLPLDAVVGQTQTGNSQGQTQGSGTRTNTGFGFNLSDFWTPSGGFK
jgi:hypothetical protein